MWQGEEGSITSVCTMQCLSKLDGCSEYFHFPSFIPQRNLAGLVNKKQLSQAVRLVLYCPVWCAT